MNYIKVTLRIDSSETYMNDLVVAYLADIEFESFEETSQGVIAYCQEANFNEQRMKDQFEFIPNQPHITYRIEQILDQNWNQTWEDAQFEPILIDNSCCVHNSKYKTDKTYQYDITINPRQAFGSGTHETTRLILSMLIHLKQMPASVIDMGCGTVVLAIMASLAGAKQVTAIDIDPWSTENCNENITLNHCYNIHVLLGDSQKLENLNCQLLMANINRNILMADMHHYAKTLQRNGQLIISGFYSDDLPLLTEKAQALKLRCVETKENNGWVAARFIMD